MAEAAEVGEGGLGRAEEGDAPAGCEEEDVVEIVPDGRARLVQRRHCRQLPFGRQLPDEAHHAARLVSIRWL